MAAHHFVGAAQTGPSQFIALARDNTITWFNYSNGFLLATGLAEATRGNQHEITTERFIDHETCHLYEDSMEPWLRSLAVDVNRAFEAGSLQPVAEQLNFEYLPERVRYWRANRTASNAMDQDEDMAAELLVEAYAHTVIEGKEIASGMWPSLDSVVANMRQTQLNPPPSSRGRPMRVMPLPQFIDVSQDLADRANDLADRANAVAKL